MSTTPDPPKQTDPANGPDPAREIDDLLQALWVKNLPILVERLNLIRTAKEKLDAGLLDEQSRKDGEEAAHKFAGILGTFGLPEGSILASKIEVVLAGNVSTCAQRTGELSSWVKELERVIASHP
jgi:HPt (histidine-containing phosphotransfer) domain-containing protein